MEEDVSWNFYLRRDEPSICTITRLILEKVFGFGVAKKFWKFKNLILDEIQVDCWLKS